MTCDWTIIYQSPDSTFGQGSGAGSGAAGATGAANAQGDTSNSAQSTSAALGTGGSNGSGSSNIDSVTSGGAGQQGVGETPLVVTGNDGVQRVNITGSSLEGTETNASQGVPVPNQFVPLTPARNKLALKIRPLVRQLNNGKEEAVSATTEGKTSVMPPCDDTSNCSATIIKDADVLVHSHPRLKPDSNDMGVKQSFNKVNERREMPGPDDYLVIFQFGIPNYIDTPSHRFVGLEYNQYKNVSGYYYSYIGDDGTVIDGPYLWDREKVK